MDFVYQALSVGLVFGLTYLFFTLIGRRSDQLLLTRDKGLEWRQFVTGKFGSVLTIANLFSTVTSLATVYLFFIGSSKLFGYWAFACCVSIVLGGVVTNYFTNRIRLLPRPKVVLASPSQSGAVVASLFWNEDAASKAVSVLVRRVSLLAIAGVIWLEFALFGDITARVMGGGTFYAAVVVWIACFFVVAFTLQFGLRGFVMADLLHSGIIVIGVLMFLLGTLFLYTQSPTLSVSSVLAPIIDTKSLLLFVVHVFIANALLGMMSESHWLRMWVFENKEVQQQVPAQMGTGVVWAALIVVGLIGSSITGKVDTENVGLLLSSLKEVSPVFVMAFWLGGTAALFSTADSQIYGFRLVFSFDTNKGEIPGGSVSVKHPLAVSIGAATLAAAVYLGVRTFAIPFDKIVFVLLPLTLNLLPAFLQLAFGRRVTAMPILISLGGYLSLATAGFFMPEAQLAYSLAAAIVPVIVGATCMVFQKREG